MNFKIYKKSLVIVVGLIICLTSGAQAVFAKGPACILKVKPELLQTSIAQDMLARNVNSKIKIEDTKIEFTDLGLKCSGTKVITFFPDVSFSTVIDLSCPKSNYIELLIRETKIIGVELKWLSRLVFGYLEKKMEDGKLSSYFSIAKTGWKKDSGGTAFSILLKLKPSNIVKALENPVIKDISISAKSFNLSVDADR